MAAMRRVYAIGKPTQATKAALLLSSALANTLERHQSLCVEGNGTIGCHKLMDYKRQVLGPFPKMLSAMFESMGIEFVPEFGKFADEHTVQAGVMLSEAEANADAYRIDEWHYGPQNEWVDNRELDIDLTLVLDNDGHLVGEVAYVAGGEQQEAVYVRIMRLAKVTDCLVCPHRVAGQHHMLKALALSIVKLGTYVVHRIIESLVPRAYENLLLGINVHGTHLAKCIAGLGVHEVDSGIV